MQRIGFVGIGLMGQQMSRRLLVAGFPLTVWNRTKERAADLLAAGAAWGDSPRALAEASDVVITMVTDSAASEEVICGPQGVLEGAHPGLILIDMGSIAPGNLPVDRRAGPGQGGADAGRAGHRQPQGGLRGQAGDHGGGAAGDVRRLPADLPGHGREDHPRRGERKGDHAQADQQPDHGGGHRGGGRGARPGPEGRDRPGRRCWRSPRWAAPGPAPWRPAGGG